MTACCTRGSSQRFRTLLAGERPLLVAQRFPDVGTRVAKLAYPVDGVQSQAEAEAVRTRASALWGTCMTGGPALLRGELQLRPH